MLAQNFMTPADLGISDGLFEALVKVLGMLERGEVKALPKEVDFLNYHYELPWGAPLQFFNMSHVAGQYDCGTAGCLLGWALSVNPDLTWGPEGVDGYIIPSLFIPKGSAFHCRDPGLAAQALRGYLSSGDPRWDEVMAEAK